MISLIFCFSARESEPVNGEKICFCLSFKTAQEPILFSCDTYENRAVSYCRDKTVVVRCLKTLINPYPAGTEIE